MDTTIERPYDMQARRYWPEDDYIDNWLESIETPILNVLIGPPGCGKTTFIKSGGIQTCLQNSAGHARPGAPRDLENLIIIEKGWRRKEVKSAVKGGEDIVYDSTNLTKKERRKFLKMIPDKYRKVAVVWELSPDDLIERGGSLPEIEKGEIEYDRPSGTEGFNEFVYII